MTPTLSLRRLILLASLSLAIPVHAQLSSGDDFNDNTKDLAKWGTDVISGGATLLEANGRLEYRVATPDAFGDDVERPWVLNTARVTDAFDVILDVFNNASPTGSNYVSVALELKNLENEEDTLYLELFRGGPSTDGKGFLTVLSSAAAHGEVLPLTLPTNHPTVTTGCVRLNYNPSTQIFTAFYDTDGSGNGYQWQVYGSFGVGASGGGSTRNSPWQLTQNLGFQIGVAAYSSGQVVGSGSVYADNFSATTLSGNADLSALALSSGTLTPTFASDTTSYTASVSNATTSITVTPTVSQANATVKVNNVTVTSGTASGAIALNVGTNTITTVVTAQDGTTAKTYTVNVVRQSSTALGGTDDFNDNSKDTSKWGTDVISGGATFVETNSRLEYRVTAPHGAQWEDIQRPWILNTAGNSDSFDVVVDVTNTGSQSVSMGIAVTSLENADDRIFIELIGGDGFLAVLDTNVINAEGDNEVLPRTNPTNHPSVTRGSVRLNYNPASKVFTAYYDTDGSENGYQWQVYGSFGVAGSGGSTRNGNWLMTQNLGFQASITAYSEELVVTSGSVYADNFAAASAPSVSVLGLTKTRHHDQTGAGTTALHAYSMQGFLEGPSHSASIPSPSNRFTRSGGGPYDLSFNDGRWEYQVFFPSKTLLDADFPNTTYNFLVGTSPAVVLPFGTESYPVQPVITTPAGTWNGGRLLISPSEALAGFTLTSNTSNGNGFLSLEVYSELEDILNEVITSNPELNGSITGTVPPGSLSVGQVYEVSAEFDQVSSSTSLNGQIWAEQGAQGYTLFSSNTLFQIEVLTPLSAWRLHYLGTIDNTGSSADTGDADGDGMVNALEFATGQHPSSPGTLNTPLVSSGGTLEFTYPRSVTALAAGVTYIVEWNDSLASDTWSTDGVNQQVQSDNGTLQQVKATLPKGTAGRRFVRLRVVLPSPAM